MSKELSAVGYFFKVAHYRTFAPASFCTVALLFGNEALDVDFAFGLAFLALAQKKL